MASYIRLFEKSSHAAAYSKYRPVHPKVLYDTVYNFTQKHTISLDTVIDIGCGSGQSTYQLSSFSKQVIGIDISSAQIDCITPPTTTSLNNVSFKVASAYELPFDDHSVAMVTCGQAWHWFDPTLINSEMLRVLKKPGGVLAIYGHGLPLIDNEKCRDVILDFYSNTLQGYWHDNRKHIDDYYNSITLPLPLTERHDIQSMSNNSLDNYISYVSTWSGYQAYMKEKPENNVIGELKDNLENIIGRAGSDKLSIVTPYFLLLCLNK